MKHAFSSMMFSAPNGPGRCVAPRYLLISWYLAITLITITITRDLITLCVFHVTYCLFASCIRSRLVIILPVSMPIVNTTWISVMEHLTENLLKTVRTITPA